METFLNYIILLFKIRSVRPINVERGSFVIRYPANALSTFVPEPRARKRASVAKGWDVPGDDVL